MKSLSATNWAAIAGLSALVAVAVFFGLGAVPGQTSAAWPGHLAAACLCGVLAGLAALSHIAGKAGVSCIASDLRKQVDRREISRLPNSYGPVLDELVQALNLAIDTCQQQVEDARSEKRQLEIQSRIAAAEKRQTEAIIFSISDAVIVTNRFDELVLANEAAEKLLGFRVDSSTRKPIDDVIDDGTLCKLITEMRKQEGSDHRKVAEHTFSQQGRSLTFEITLSRVPGPGSESAGVVAVLHDVTREKEIAQMKTDFVSSVSHELKTPLASIKAYIEMLVDGEVSDEKQQQEFYEIISTETDRLGRLIENILGISRIEAGVVKVARTPVSLTGLVRQVIDVVAPQAKLKGIELVDHLAPVFYQVEADQDMIYQAVMNLLSNAVKYTPENGTVTVRVGVDESRGLASVEVEDTGAGIPAEDLPHIFDKFYRVKANKKMAKGTGLGLTLVRHIIETVHEGKLSVTSDEGSGSTFTMELPVLQ